MTISASQSLDLPALGLSAALHERRLTCTQVMEAALERIDAVNPAHNAIVSLRPREELLAEAGRADAELADGRSRGWLHGFPFAIKDLSEAAGLPCTWGSLLYKDHVSTRDELHVARIRAAGAILIGKTNTPEMGFGSHTTNRVFGPARNAFDTTRSAGGSSGGAAVALSLGLLPVADGSDMMGSLRNPAAFNGVYGFRPSYGRIPNPGAKDLYFSQLATSGPMGRTVADMAALLDTMSGADRFDPLCLDGPLAALKDCAAGGQGARVAWLGDLGGYLPMEPGILETCDQGRAIFAAAGVEVEGLVPEFDMADLWFCWTVLRSFSTGFRLLPLAEDAEKLAMLGPQALWELENRRRITLDDVARATDIRSRWFECLVRLFDRFDALVLPSAQVFPFDVHARWPEEIAGRRMDTYHRWMEVVIAASLVGLPVAAVPAGLSAEGLPMGVQIIGRPRADGETLALAAAYEAAGRKGAFAGLDGKVPVLMKD